MSSTHSFFRNITLALAALATSGSLVTATTAQAARGDVYRVELAQPAAQQGIRITRNVGWTCEDSVCTAADSGSADRHVCVWIAREMGMVTEFRAGDRVFTAEEIALCNERA